METQKKQREKEQTIGVCMETPRKKGWWQRHFTAKRMALMGIFVALSYAVSFLEFPIFPSATFLKLDFGNVFITLISFLLGPIEGLLVCLLKEGLRALSSSTGGVGELANICVTCSFIIIPAFVYQFKKGIKIVVLCLMIACLLGTGVALITNRFIMFPLFMGKGAAAFFEKNFWLVLAFNLIKTLSVSILTLLLYKRLSNFLKNNKF
jgi:riboflavin transporter FmnP